MAAFVGVLRGGEPGKFAVVRPDRKGQFDMSRQATQPVLARQVKKSDEQARPSRAKIAPLWRLVRALPAPRSGGVRIESES